MCLSELLLFAHVKQSMLTTLYTSNPNVVYLPDIKVTENNYATVERIERMLYTLIQQMVNDAAIIKLLQQAHCDNEGIHIGKK